MTLGTVSGLGTGGSAYVTGNDECGIFGFTTGTGSGGVLVLFNYSSNLYGASAGPGGGPFVRVYPLDAAASAIDPQVGNSDTSHFYIQPSSVADNTTYTWAYKVG